MSRTLMLLLAVTAGAGIGWAARSTRARDPKVDPTPPVNASSPDAPLACNLDALSAPERDRHAVLLEKVSGMVLEMRELPDGYAYRFAPGARSVAELGEWIGLERACCPFLRFAVEVEPDGGPVWLRLTGTAQVKELIGAAFHPTGG